jgi:hypothetical protein
MKQPSPRTPPHDRSTSRRAHAGPALALLLGVLAGCRSDSSGTPARSAGEGPDAAGNGPREPRRHDAATFYSTTAYQGASFSHDGKSLLVTSDQSGVFNAYAVELTAGGGAGAWRALTNSSSDSINSLSWFPRDNRFLYTADQGGNELHHVFVGLPDGNSADLTPGPKTKARFEGWAGDQASFFIATNERDPQFFDLYRYREDAGNASGNVARVSRANCCSRIRAGTSSPRFQGRSLGRPGQGPRQRQLRSLRGAHVPGRRAPARQPHQGNGAFPPWNSRRTARASSISPISIASTPRSGATTWRVRRAARCSPPIGTWPTTPSPRTARTLAVSINADARTQVRLFEASTGAEIPLPPLSGSEISGIVFERGTAGSLLRRRRPHAAQPARAGPGQRSQAKLTQALSPAIQEQDLVESEVVRFPSFYGL